MPLKLLIVDDSITVKAILKKALIMTGLDIGEVHTAANGVEALDFLREHDVDLVFSDLMMPVMGGEEMLSIMKEEGITERIPVVVLSSAGGTPRLQRLKDLGVRGFVHKPFTPEQIKQLVQEHTGVEMS